MLVVKLRNGHFLFCFWSDYLGFRKSSSDPMTRDLLRAFLSPSSHFLLFFASSCFLSLIDLKLLLFLGLFGYVNSPKHT